MTQSTRKFIGVFATLVMLVIYCGLATALYLVALQSAPTWLSLIYFAVVGTAWCIPAMVIIRWMARPDPTP